MHAPTPTIAVQALVKKYGDFTAVHGLTFSVAAGEVLGLVGPNGAGKTSTLHCLAGISRALLLEWYGAVEVDEPLDVLTSADEVFLVSTTRDVQAVHRCDDRELAVPGPVTGECMKVWAEREAADVDP